MFADFQAILFPVFVQFERNGQLIINYGIFYEEGIDKALLNVI